ncbi:hypothetical protein D9613_006332 [Agrocybe pediades]|uniref:Uncharacterized protein n=1 Tax=Agrocybe pediades TaxID=84607 RepID=A0A8H4VPH2_9AGAR|nr:hypothetical protein D9613_006332 [Agrocybe pediades]
MYQRFRFARSSDLDSYNISIVEISPAQFFESSADPDPALDDLDPAIWSNAVEPNLSKVAARYLGHLDLATHVFPEGAIDDVAKATLELLRYDGRYITLSTCYNIPLNICGTTLDAQAAVCLIYRPSTTILLVLVDEKTLLNKAGNAETQVVRQAIATFQFYGNRESYAPNKRSDHARLYCRVSPDDLFISQLESDGLLYTVGTESVPTPVQCITRNMHYERMHYEIVNCMSKKTFTRDRHVLSIAIASSLLPSKEGAPGEYKALSFHLFAVRHLTDCHAVTPATAFALSLFRPGSFCWRNTLDFSRLLPAISTTHGKLTSRLLSMPPMKVLFTEFAATRLPTSSTTAALNPNAHASLASSGKLTASPTPLSPPLSTFSPSPNPNATAAEEEVPEHPAVVVDEATGGLGGSHEGVVLVPHCDEQPQVDVTFARLRLRAQPLLDLRLVLGQEREKAHHLEGRLRSRTSRGLRLAAIVVLSKACVSPVSSISVYWSAEAHLLLLPGHDQVTWRYALSFSDPGSENYGIANAHTTLRHMHDRSLEGTVQHRWMRHKKNVKPEATWSQFRRRFAPGFEDLLELGVTNGWYDITRPIDALTFRWVFIPYIQSEVDAYVHRVNFTKKRSDKNKVLPHGIPEDIATNPGAFGCLDFGINVDPAAIDYVEQLYAPRDDPVFQLVPPTFHEHISRVYAELGCPPVTFETAWDVYRMLVLRLEDLQARADNENFKSAMDDWEVEAHLLTHGDEEDHGNDLPYGPPEGAELAGGEVQVRPDGSIYMGGVNGGRGLDSNLEARLDELTEADNDFEFEIDEQGVATEFEDDSDYEDLNPGVVGQW